MVKSILRNRDTVGTIATDLMQKEAPTTDVREQGAEMLKPYLEELFAAVERGKKEMKGDFFIQVLTTRFRTLTNVVRNQFVVRYTCPTPNYDQTVYLWKHADQELNYIWSIPDRQSAHDLIDNALTIEDEYRELLQYVLDFADGTLFKLAQKLNNEEGLKTGIVLKTTTPDQAQKVMDDRKAISS